MVKLKNILNEGKPIPQDTPNEFAYLDFKKWAYKNRSQYKKDIQTAGDNPSKVWKIATKWWHEWAKRKAKQWTVITDSQKFGRALVVMMWKDNLIFDKKSNRISKLKEVKLKEFIPGTLMDFKKKPGDIWQLVISKKWASVSPKGWRMSYTDNRKGKKNAEMWATKGKDMEGNDEKQVAKMG